MAQKSDDERKMDTRIHAMRRKLKSKPTSALLELLSSESEVKRTAAVRELHSRGEKEALDHALELCGSDRWEFREISVFLISQLGTPNSPFKVEIVPVLEKMLLNDPSSDVRASAAAGLGHHNAKCSIETLTTASNDVDPGVRDNVAFTLGSIAFPENSRLACSELNAVVICLAKLASDSAAEVRDMAAWALGMTGSPKAFDHLEALLNDPNDEVVESAKDGLEILRENLEENGGSSGVNPCIETKE